MNRIATILALVASCASYPRMAPSAWSTYEQTANVVRVSTRCGWSTGVAITERHVVTAAHAVNCAMTLDQAFEDAGTGAASDISIEFPDHDFFHAYVVKTLPGDVAVLEVFQVLNFDRNIVPPVISNEWWTVEPKRYTRPGDSGAPIYGKDGSLVGIVTTALECTTAWTGKTGWHGPKHGQHTDPDGVYGCGAAITPLWPLLGSLPGQGG